MSKVDINKMTKKELLAYIAQKERRAFYTQLFDNSACETPDAPPFNGSILIPDDFQPGWYDIALFYPKGEAKWVFKFQLKEMTKEYAEKAQAKLDAYHAKREEAAH